MCRVTAATSSDAVDWACCPGDPLIFSLAQSFEVSEMRLGSDGKWYFRTKVRKMQAAPHDGLSQVQLQFESRWAPYSATVEGKHPSALIEHLQSEKHCAYEARIAVGES